MKTYLGLLRKEADSDFGVSFPDFPGCVTAGKTLEEARELAAEALDLHVDGMLSDGEDIPAPSDLDDVMADPENRDGIAILVELHQAKPRAVRVNITLDERTLREIDDYVEQAGLSRSGFLSLAARRELDRAS